jgi:hypothetical protein
MMLTPFGPDYVQSGDDLKADPASHLASAVNTNGIAIIAASHLQAAAMVRYSIGSAVYVLDKQLRNPRLDHIRRAIDTAGAEGARALDSSMLALVTLSTSPFWAHRYIRFFLAPVRESARTCGNGRLIVSETVIGAARFPGDLARILQYSERTSVSLIVLSLRNCREDLLIERFTIQTAIRRYYPAPMTTRKTARARCSSTPEQRNLSGNPTSTDDSSMQCAS